MSNIRKGSCGMPGPGNAHCTDYPIWCVAVGLVVGVLVIAPITVLAWVSTRDSTIEF